jgi:cell division protein FtsB
MYEQLEPRNDRVQIQYGFDKVTIESIHDSDTVDNLLDLCVRAIRGLGFHFKHPQDEIAEYERILFRIAEIVEEEDPDPTSPGDVVDAVYRTVQKLLDNRAEKRQTIADLREEVQDLKQIRDDLQLKVSTQQIGIDAQKARIEELTNRLQILDGPISTKNGESFWLPSGSFAWASSMLSTGHKVRRLGWGSEARSINPAVVSREMGKWSIELTGEDFSAFDWIVG